MNVVPATLCRRHPCQSPAQPGSARRRRCITKVAREPRYVELAPRQRGRHRLLCCLVDAGGLFLVLVVGLLVFRFRPESPWIEVLAALFGVGAALALDEFALWLHLEDVYWSEEGKKSIDAVMIAAVFGLVLLTGTSPISVSTDTETFGAWAVSGVSASWRERATGKRPGDQWNARAMQRAVGPRAASQHPAHGAGREP